MSTHKLKTLAVIIAVGTMVGLPLHYTEPSAHNAPAEYCKDEACLAKRFLRENYPWKSQEEFCILKETFEFESHWNMKSVSRTGDYGIAQIHASAHDKTAKANGLDYKNNWEDNIKLALIIYKKSGIKPWNAYKNHKKEIHQTCFEGKKTAAK